MLFKCLLLICPWRIRRRLLERVYGYRIHPTARIRCSWIFPKHLEMAAHSQIGPFTVAVHLDQIQLGERSKIGRRNWITGFPTGTDSPHFAHQKDRVSELVIGQHSAITKNHHIDCTNTIRIGDYATIAGYFSQLLTHSIDLKANRQSSAPIRIGNYCFVGTKVVILGGASLPDRSVLGASALLSTSFEEPDCLYGGVPAKFVKKLSDDLAYFRRESGFVE